MLYYTQKSNLKRSKNIGHRTIKLLEENKGDNFIILNWKRFLRCDIKSTYNKRKIALSDYIKTKTFCASKDTINRVKSNSQNEQETSANSKPDKGLISKIYHT